MTQRSIKFRAFLDGKMRYNVDALSTGKSSEDGTCVAGIIQGDGTTQPDIRAALMQFTGLKDKNGKEIYEGDVVREDNFEKLGPQQIVWFGGVFWLDNNHVLISDHEDDPVRCEIIGNVHENPELLTKDHHA